MLVNTNSAIRYYSSFHSRSTMYIYCHYKTAFLSDNVRCISLFLLFIDRNVLLIRLRYEESFCYCTCICTISLTFLDKNIFCIRYSAPKLGDYWHVSRMAQCTNRICRQFKYIFNQIKIMPAVRILWLHFTIVYNSSGLKKIQWNRDNQKCLLLKWFSFDLSRFKSIPDPIRYICVWHEYFIRPFDYHY